jgi:fructose/tagatose bisphosphate aldolase
VHPAESAYAGNQNMVGSPRWSAAATSSPASTWTIARPPTRSWNAFATATPASCSTVPPLEQNLQLTRDVVRVARPAGVSVEAEVGTIGTTAEYGAEIENPHLADPAACEAMGETGIDALAVAISNAHGVYIADPNSTSTSSPKSDGAPKCHWCCTAAQQSRSTRSRRRSAGVAKMNVGTAIHVAFKEGMEEGLAENPGSHDIMKILSGCQPRVRDVLRQYVDITMSAGRAA